MTEFEFPLRIKFQILTLSNDFVLHDNRGKTIAYIRQKMLKLIEHVQVFDNENRNNIIYNIHADRWLDFNASYTFYNRQGVETGRITRKGWRSIWKAHYELYNQQLEHTYSIDEANPWMKVIDSFFGEIPVLGALTGYFFHPIYLVSDKSGKAIVKLKKEPSFWGRKFSIHRLNEEAIPHLPNIILGLTTMILLEHSRG